MNFPGLGHFCTIIVYLGLSQSISNYLGLSLTISYFLRLSLSPMEPVCQYSHKHEKVHEFKQLKGVSSGHKSVTSILPNNPTMLPLFSLFMNFPPIMSGSHSGLIIGFELPPH